MSMNSYPNNDPKQCTVSKLGRVHNVHTQDLVARTPHVVAPCRSVVSRVAASCRCLISRHKNRVAIQNHVACALGRVASAARRIAHALGCIATPCHSLLPLPPLHRLSRVAPWRVPAPYLSRRALLVVTQPAMSRPGLENGQ